MDNIAFSFTTYENTRNNPNKLKFAYESDPPRLKSVGHVNTLFEMHDLMSRSLNIIAPPRSDDTSRLVTYNNYTDVDELDRIILENGIFFSPDFPEFLMPKSRQTSYHSEPQFNNAITWGVVRSEPGTVSGPPFGGTQEIRPRHREYVLNYGNYIRKYIPKSYKTVDESYSEKLAYTNIKGQVFDNLVQYNIWGKSNYEVERLLEWFHHKYMDNYIGMFRESGIVNLFFYKRVRDNTLTNMDNGYHVRSVLYYIRTEYISLEYIGPINKIVTNVNVDAFPGEDQLNIESERENLLSKWIQINNRRII